MTNDIERRPLHKKNLEVIDNSLRILAQTLVRLHLSIPSPSDENKAALMEENSHD